MPHVFVYGTLRRGGRNDIARYRPAPQLIGEASIAGTLFDLGAYPGIVLAGERRVRGEVYAIEPAVEAALDVLEEVADDDSGEYIKRQVRVDVGGQWFDCLVYEIHPTRIAGRAVIESGDWIAHAARGDTSFSQPKD
jgi:gamma-glutamylcyclotransferase (GGCT)/AIG2-like uncharacterized protein YtfP